MVQERKNINIIFICSMNKWRSPTAEKIYRKLPHLNVRSAGTSPKARRHVSHIDLEWADVVIAMETKHVQKLKSNFPELMREIKVYTLDIEDRYTYMDPELVEELKSVIDPIIDGYIV